MLGRSISAALILAVGVSGASGLEALIGDAFVTLPPPAGFCELTPRYEFDGRTVAIASAYLKGDGIRLLAMSADCDQLAEARKGRRRQVDDVAQYQVQTLDEKTPPVFSIARMCSILRLQSKSPVGTDINARLAGTLEKIKVNEIGFIGVIAEDENACYSATVHKAWTEAGTEKVLAGLHAATIISNRAIGVRRYAVYQNPDTIGAILAKLKGDVAALIAANR
ncbi:MAG TPA: hypothetical protein VEK73_16980 [Xanthobacteraceae bacterium]|nr:hypothetical protein [Xanthobacteraceae bacterium]